MQYELWLSKAWLTNPARVAVPEQLLIKQAFHTTALTAISIWFVDGSAWNRRGFGAQLVYIAVAVWLLWISCRKALIHLNFALRIDECLTDVEMERLIVRLDKAAQEARESAKGQIAAMQELMQCETLAAGVAARVEARVREGFDNVRTRETKTE